eukprot:PhM_4_TR8054/c0_g1_i1/m.30624
MSRRARRISSGNNHIALSRILGPASSSAAISTSFSSGTQQQDSRRIECIRCQLTSPTGQGWKSAIWSLCTFRNMDMLVAASKNNKKGEVNPSSSLSGCCELVLDHASSATTWETTLSLFSNMMARDFLRQNDITPITSQSLLRAVLSSSSKHFCKKEGHDEIWSEALALINSGALFPPRAASHLKQCRDSIHYLVLKAAESGTSRMNKFKGVAEQILSLESRYKSVGEDVFFNSVDFFAHLTRHATAVRNASWDDVLRLCQQLPDSSNMYLSPLYQQIAARTVNALSSSSSGYQAAYQSAWWHSLKHITRILLQVKTNGKNNQEGASAAVVSLAAFLPYLREHVPATWQQALVVVGGLHLAAGSSEEFVERSIRAGYVPPEFVLSVVPSLHFDPCSEDLILSVPHTAEYAAKIFSVLYGRHILKYKNAKLPSLKLIRHVARAMSTSGDWRRCLHLVSHARAAAAGSAITDREKYGTYLVTMESAIKSAVLSGNSDVLVNLTKSLVQLQQKTKEGSEESTIELIKASPETNEIILRALTACGALEAAAEFAEQAADLAILSKSNDKNFVSSSRVLFDLYKAMSVKEGDAMNAPAVISRVRPQLLEWAKQIDTQARLGAFLLEDGGKDDVSSRFSEMIRTAVKEGYPLTDKYTPTTSRNTAQTVVLSRVLHSLGCREGLALLRWMLDQRWPISSMHTGMLRMAALRDNDADCARQARDLMRLVNQQVFEAAAVFSCGDQRYSVTNFPESAAFTMYQDLVDDDLSHVLGQRAIDMVREVEEVTAYKQVKAALPIDQTLDLTADEQFHSLAVHAEKKALAFHLMLPKITSKWDAQSPIRIDVNMRMCADCRAFFLAASEHYDVRLEVKDGPKTHIYDRGMHK